MSLADDIDYYDSDDDITIGKFKGVWKPHQSGGDKDNSKTVCE